MQAPFVENAFFFPLYNFSCFVKNWVFVGMWVNNSNYSPMNYRFIFMTWSVHLEKGAIVTPGNGVSS